MINYLISSCLKSSEILLIAKTFHLNPPLHILCTKPNKSEISVPPYRKFITCLSTFIIGINFDKVILQVFILSKSDLLVKIPEYHKK